MFGLVGLGSKFLPNLTVCNATLTYSHVPITEPVVVIAASENKHVGPKNLELRPSLLEN